MTKKLKQEANVNAQVLQKILRQLSILTYACFSVNVFNILNAEAASRGVDVNYILPALLSALGLFCGMSTIKVFNSNTSPLFYTCLAAQPSTGKTKAMKLITNAITSVERHLNITDQTSRQVNAPTIESLLTWLKEYKTIIANFDESTQFFSSFGLYKNGGGGGDYEKSFYLSLWSAPDNLIRDLCKVRVRVDYPKLQLSLCSHPWWVAETMTDVKETHDDGFYHRLLFVVPDQIEISSADLNTPPRTIVSIEAIFLFIYTLHIQAREYIFDAEGQVILSTLFDSQGSYARQANRNTQYFLAAMCGKATEIFGRLCLVLKAIHVACDGLEGLPGANSSSLTENFGISIQQLVSTGNASRFVINKDIATKAFSLLEFFQKTALILSQHEIDARDSIDQVIQKLLKSHYQLPQLGGEFISMGTTLVSDMRKLMDFEKMSVTARDITKGNSAVAPVELAMRELERVGLGATFYIKGANNKRMMRFDKKKHAQLVGDRLLGRKIQDLGFILTDFLNRLESIEISEAQETVEIQVPTIDAASKRPRSTTSSPNESLNKKKHAAPASAVEVQPRRMSDLSHHSEDSHLSTSSDTSSLINSTVSEVSLEGNPNNANLSLSVGTTPQVVTELFITYSPNTQNCYEPNVPSDKTKSAHSHENYPVNLVDNVEPQIIGLPASLNTVTDSIPTNEITSMSTNLTHSTMDVMVPGLNVQNILTATQVPMLNSVTTNAPISASTQVSVLSSVVANGVTCSANLVPVSNQKKIGKTKSLSQILRPAEADTIAPVDTITPTGTKKRRGRPPKNPGKVIPDATVDETPRLSHARSVNNLTTILEATETQQTGLRDEQIITSCEANMRHIPDVNSLNPSNTSVTQQKQFTNNI